MGKIGGVAAFVLLVGVCGVANAGSSKTPVFLQFWTVEGGRLEPLDLTIPRVKKTCPDGFSAISDTDHCGRDITLSVSLYVGGEDISRETAMLQYGLHNGQWVTFIELFPGLRNISIEPFKDVMGLRHFVTGTIHVRTDDGFNWYAAQRNTDHPFLVETIPGRPFIRHVECRINRETSDTHASL